MTIHLKPTVGAASEIVDMVPEGSFYRSGIKRVFDILFVCAALPFILPVILIIAALIALDGGNPFFIQRRVGKDGRVFSMIKLRSMVTDAETKLLDYLEQNPEAKQEWVEKQKLSNDPRITLVGRVIRKTSIDELPQFFNVLFGDMSVVGPRPMLPSQREMYPGQAYYAMKPGVTGFWQIGDRHEAGFAERAHYDADYFRKMSLRTDVFVIFQTVRVVCRGTGA